jgi:hypothetical protein
MPGEHAGTESPRRLAVHLSKVPRPRRAASKQNGAKFFAVEDPAGNTLASFSNYSTGVPVVNRTSEFKEGGCTAIAPCEIVKPATLTAAGSYVVTANQ